MIANLNFLPDLPPEIRKETSRKPAQLVPKASAIGTEGANMLHLKSVSELSNEMRKCRRFRGPLNHCDGVQKQLLECLHKDYSILEN